jgi:hypothetical protein
MSARTVAAARAALMAADVACWHGLVKPDPTGVLGTGGPKLARPVPRDRADLGQHLLRRAAIAVVAGRERRPPALAIMQLIQG